MQVQDHAKTTLRGEKPVEEWTDAQGNAAFPDDSKIPRGHFPTDIRPVEIPTKT